MTDNVLDLSGKKKIERSGEDPAGLTLWTPHLAT
jgi:hypothetical protein